MKKAKSFEVFHAIVTLVSIIGLFVGYLMGDLNTLVLFGFLAVINLLSIAVLQRRE